MAKVDRTASIDSESKQGALVASWRHDADTAEVAEARHTTGKVLIDWGCDGLVDDAQLVVTELVTNAILHTESPCTVSLQLSDSALHIAVTDHGLGFPERQPFDLHREGGRGLLIVSSLADAWGVEPVDQGKTVWATLAA